MLTDSWVCHQQRDAHVYWHTPFFVITARHPRIPAVLGDVLVLTGEEARFSERSAIPAETPDLAKSKAESARTPEPPTKRLDQTSYQSQTQSSKRQ